MSTVSSTVPSSVYSAYLPQYQGPQVNDPALVQEATNLSEEANILSTLGATSTISQTSNPTSLLSWLVQPYASTDLPLPSLGSGNVSSLAQDNVDQQVLSGQSASAGNSGIYTSTGVLQAQAGDPASEWSTMMQNNPTEAAAMNQAATDQGILRQLSAYA